MILAPIAALVSGRVVHGVSTVHGLPGAIVDQIQMTSIATALATLAAWAAFGTNTAIIVKVKNGVQSSIMGVSAGVSTFNFTWGAVMPMSLIAAVSATLLSF